MRRFQSTSSRLRRSRKLSGRRAKLALELLEPRLALATFVVNTDANIAGDDFQPGDGICDTGSHAPGAPPVCTLGAAVEEINASDGPSTLMFSISKALAGGRSYVITKTVTIDGGGEARESSPLILEGDNNVVVGMTFNFGFTLRNGGGSKIDGNTILSMAVFNSSNNEIGGIARNYLGGVSISGAGSTGNSLLNNYIGMNQAGLQLCGGCSGRVDVREGGANQIGAAAKGNVITGGVVLASEGNKVQANRIGTNPAGDAKHGFAVGGGISIQANNNLIGGPADQDGNLVSGTSNGIRIENGTSHNRIERNLIGTDVTGTLPIGNELGVYIVGDNNFVTGNVIAATQDSFATVTGVGVNIDGSNNTVTGNFIGAGRDGASNASLGNEKAGIIVHGSNNNIGGPGSADGNVIQGNGGPGVLVYDRDAFDGVTPQGNRILRNAIFGNAGLAIDLGGLFAEGRQGDGPTANDLGDPGASPPVFPDVDAGVNRLQNAPLITQNCNGRSQVTLQSKPDTPFRIEFFRNATTATAGSAAGSVYLVSAELRTDEHGFGSVVGVPELGPGFTLSATATDPDGNTSEFSNLTARPPVFVLPGIGGTFPVADHQEAWYLNRGVPPSYLQIDPMAHIYDDLLITLQRAGYVLGKDLIVVNYDWRVLPGPNDGVFDGNLAGLTAVNISSGPTIPAGQNPLEPPLYRFGVDYLGEALRNVAENWNSDCSGIPLEGVDVIAHSTGGLVTRSYIQSDAYNGVYEGDKRLPKINTFVMLDVPNQGASKPWNTLHDDWGFDKSYRALSKFPKAGFLKLALDDKEGNERVIRGPDYTIHRGDQPDTDTDKYVQAIVDEGVAWNDVSGDTVDFIEFYVPTLRTLLSSYPFIRQTDGSMALPEAPAERNWMAMDLNGGQDVNAFADRVANAISVFGDGVDTPATVKPENCWWVSCPDRFSIVAGAMDIDRASGELYFIDEINRVVDGVTEKGDGTVPYVSLAGQFVDDDRVVLSRWAQRGSGAKDENTDFKVAHTDIVANPDVLRAILEFLGNNTTGLEISHDQQTIFPEGYWSLTSDPVETILIDANGNRLGYSQATGVLTEIPNSVYFGKEEGLGFVFGTLATPARLELRGLGEPYYVEISGFQDGKVVELTASGAMLAAGESKSFDVVPAPPPSVDFSLAAAASPIVEATLAQLNISVTPTGLPLRFEYDLNDDDVTDVTNATGAVSHTFPRHGTKEINVRIAFGVGAVSKTLNVVVHRALSNPRQPLDVDDDASIAPLDALVVINELNARGARQLPPPGSPDVPAWYVDVDRDGFVAPIDALVVINDLNLNGPRDAEGESTSPALTDAAYAEAAHALPAFSPPARRFAISSTSDAGPPLPPRRSAKNPSDLANEDASSWRPSVVVGLIRPASPGAAFKTTKDWNDLSEDDLGEDDLESIIEEIARS